MSFMPDNERLIFDALMSLSNYKSFEFLNHGDKAILKGVKKGFIKNDETVVTIRKPTSKKTSLALINTKVNDREISVEVEKELLYAMLREVSVLSQEHFMQIIIVLNTENQRVVNFSDFAIHAFHSHINKSFPKLKHQIKIQALGDRNEELAFVIEKGFDDKDFQDFFECGIKLKAALKNCRNFKIEKLVFFDAPKNTYQDFSIDELELMAER